MITHHIVSSKLAQGAVIILAVLAVAVADVLLKRASYSRRS